MHRRTPTRGRRFLDVARITTRLQRRILRYLVRCGRLVRAEHDEEELQPDEPRLAELYAASVQGRAVVAGADVPLLLRQAQAPQRS